MPLEPNQSSRPEESGWYHSINPNEHAYTSGYGFSPRPPEIIEQRMIRQCGTSVGFSLLGYFLAQMVLPNLLSRMAYNLLPSAFYHTSLIEIIPQAGTMLGSALALILPFSIYGVSVKIPISAALPLRKSPGWLTICGSTAVLCTSVIGLYASQAFSALLAQAGFSLITPDLRIPRGTVAFILFSVNMTLIPALFEEMAFRGFLMQSLRRFGDGFALLSSAVIFGLVHINPQQMPGAFLAGLVIGYFVLYTGSLWTGVMMHFVNNLLVLLQMILLQRLPPAMQPMAQLIVFLAYFAIGLVAVIAAVRSHATLFSLRGAESINTEPVKLRAFFSSVTIVVVIVLIALMSADYIQVA